MDQAKVLTSPSLACTDFNGTELIEGILKQLEVRQQDLDQEVEALQDRLKKREWQKRLLSRNSRIQNPTITPINQLSLPVLRKIFQFCIPHNRNSVMCNKDAPISLCQVCHSWRQIALTAPELWTAIHITVTSANWSCSDNNPTPRKPEVLRLQAISSWLSRSGELPLSISIGSWDAMGPPVSLAKFEKILSSYLERLSLFSRRWQRIFFYLPYIDAINNFFLRYKSTDLPLLEKLHLDGVGCNTGKLTSARALKAITKEDSFLRCPKLRWLSLPLLGGLLLEAPAQWSQLTVLNLNGASGCPLFQIMGTIAACSSLQSLSVCFDLPHPDVDLSLEQAVTLPHLSSLCVIERFPSFDSQRFFHHLLAPNIRYLAYERYTPVLGGQDQSSDPFSRISLSTQFLTAFKLFVSRARYPIEEFALSYDWLTDGDIYQFLAILPDLKCLQLQGSGGQTNLTRWPRPPSGLLLFDDALIGGLLTIPDKRDIVTVVTKDTEVPELDRVQDPSGGAGDTGWGIRSEVRPGFGTTRSFEEDGDTWQETSNFLSPKLEVFQCTGAAFTAEAFLKFLQSRAFPSKRFGISRLRTVDISFVLWEGVSGPLDQIKALAEEVGMSVFLHFPASSSRWIDDPSPLHYSACDGMLSVGYTTDEFLAFRAAF